LRRSDTALTTWSKWLAIAYALALAPLVLISAGLSFNPLIMFTAVLGLAWTIGPVAIAYLLVRKSPSPGWAKLFLLLQLALLLFTGWMWYLMLVVDPDAQAPIALFIFIPLYEYAAVGLSILLATVFGWRSREDLPPDSSSASLDG